MLTDTQVAALIKRLRDNIKEIDAQDAVVPEHNKQFLQGKADGYRDVIWMLEVTGK